MTIEQKLDQLANLQAQADLLISDYMMVRDAAVPMDIKARLADIETEMQPAINAARDGIEALRNEIEADVIKAGATVKGSNLQAVYYKGRVTWDSKALEGFSAAHPEITAFRKVGEPSVQFKSVAGSR